MTILEIVRAKIKDAAITELDIQLAIDEVQVVKTIAALMYLKN